MSLRYLGPWDPGTLGPLDLGTLGPWDSWTSSLLQHLLILPLTSSYLLLSLPPTLLLWYGLVREGGWVELWELLLPYTFSSSNLLPPPSYSSQLLLPPPKPPPNSSYLLLKGLRWLISSYMKRFQCYSAQKSLVGGWVFDIAIIATSSRSRSLIRDLRLTLDLDPSLTIRGSKSKIDNGKGFQDFIVIFILFYLKVN